MSAVKSGAREKQWGEKACESGAGKCLPQEREKACGKNSAKAGEGGRGRLLPAVAQTGGVASGAKRDVQEALLA